MIRTTLIALLLLPVMAWAAGGAEVRVFTKSGEVPLKLELATTPQERTKGLMKRYELAPYDGMLFIFPEAGPHRFWMKDTPISLDMLFFSKGGTITQIHPYTKPYSTLPIGEGKKGKQVIGVIELDGGQAASKGIAVGDKVRYELPETVEVR